LIIACACCSDENRVPSPPPPPAPAGRQPGGGGRVRRDAGHDVGGRGGRVAGRRRARGRPTAADAGPVSGVGDAVAGDERQQRGHAADEQHGPDQLHEQAADRAGEGVPLQPVPDAGPADRDRVRAAAERDPGEDMVPEQADETEETAAGGPAADGAAAPAGHASERREQHQ